MKVKMFRVINPQVASALSKLVNHEEVPVSVIAKLYGTLKKVEALQKQHDEFRALLLKKYATKDQNGNVSIKDGRIEFPNEDIEVKCNKAYQECLEEEVEFDLVSISDLGDVKMKPVELFSLVGLFVKDDFADTPMLGALKSELEDEEPKETSTQLLM